MAVEKGLRRASIDSERVRSKGVQLAEGDSGGTVDSNVLEEVF